MSLSLVELHILHGLAEGKTLLRIGQELHVSQPAVSKLLRAAERRVGLTLVEQQGRRLVLTPAGAECAGVATLVLAQLQALDHTMDTLRAGRAGPVHVLSASTPGNYVLPSLISQFLRQAPGADIVLQIATAESFWDMFLGQHTDLGIAAQAAWPPGVRGELLYHDPIHFFVGSSNPLAGCQQATPGALRDQPLVTSVTGPYWSQLLGELARRGLTFARQVDLRTPEAIKRFVETGNGVGILFGSALHREFADGRLVPVPIADLALSQGFWLVERQTALLSPVAWELREFLTHHIQQMYASEL
jgi:DNA-binding transcriptional LysR family regulator